MNSSFFSIFKSRQVWFKFITNFFIWSIPGIFALIIFLFVLFISFSGSDGSLLQIEVNPPKGLMSFVSFGMICSSLAIFNSIWYFAPISLESSFEIGFFGVIVLFFGLLFFYIEFKRIHSVVYQPQ